MVHGAPHWGWLIVLYFFVGGLAGGSYFLAALIDLFGRREDRPLARLGYYIAFPCVALSGIVLTLDLGRPLRFWHMLIESEHVPADVQVLVADVVGSWALLPSVFFTFLSFLGALAEDDSPYSRWPASHYARRPHWAGSSAARRNFGLYVAGYTGVLLGVTNRPIWSDTPLLGMLFVVSAASTSAALMTSWRTDPPGPCRAWQPASNGRLGHRAGVAGLHRVMVSLGACPGCVAEWLGLCS